LHLDTREWHFHAHDKALAHGSSEQDVLCKFNLPSTERVRVLEYLNEYNLNAFSLFDSEESLMETMWLQEVVFTEGGAANLQGIKEILLKLPRQEPTR
jgi:hypothetical protein